MSDDGLAGAIEAARRAEHLSFHMPGHRHGAGASADAVAFLGASAFAHDVSELSGFDYLHDPGAALTAAQARAASLFGAEHTWFLVNGSTVGNLAAITAVAGPGTSVVMARASHRSVYSAVAVAGATPVYLPPTFTADGTLWLGPSLDATAAVLRSTPDVAALHVTSPSYYGVCVDVAAYAALAHEHGVPLIVDEAHGAHFALHPDLPPSALSQGADLVVQSPHKTLSSLTQSSFLHVRGGLVDRARVGRWLGMLQSSSPSALLLASLDLTVAAMARDGEARWGEVLRLAARMRPFAEAVPDMVCDPTKVRVRVTGVSGYALEAALHERGIRPEFADPHRIVCSVGLGHTEPDVDTLLGAIEAVRPGHDGSDGVPAWPDATPAMAMPPAAALHAPVEAVPWPAALGRVAGEYVIPYPPGVPLVVPGEVVEPSALAYVDAVRAAGGRIVGPADTSGRSLEVVADVRR